ncbi:hypothetical protein F5888DRAFT_1635368 [Russula emetica]|nr:hypothetical protein F5888DRAFT_1635368 [Russula emetica]
MPLKYAGGECALRYGLKREVKDKPIADGVDVALLLMQLWSPTDTLFNTRMRQQVATYIILAADLASRPGNIIKSCAYKDSNEALSYQDLTFYTLPPFNVERGQTIFAAPNMPTVSLAETPQLLVRVKFWYLKGKRADEDKLKGANELDEAANVTVAQRTAIMGHDPLSRLFLRYQKPDLAPIRALGQMSLNADKAAPIAVSVEERRCIWTLPEVEALLEEQTKVKRACIAEYGSVGSAKGTLKVKAIALNIVLQKLLLLGMNSIALPLSISTGLKTKTCGCWHLIQW